MHYIEWIREKVGHQKLLLVYASACIRDPEGQILWQRRSDFDFWGLPGGVLELDETLEECVVREVNEETGLDVRITQLIGIYSSPDFDVTYPNQDQVQQITFCYDCEPVGGTLRADLSETLELKWLPPWQQPPSAPWYQAMLNDALNGDSAVSFTRGSLGKVSSPIPFYQQIRPFIGHACFTSPATSSFVLNERHELLMIQRQDNGDWDLPGGLMELGERIDQAAVRETREETGWDIQIDQCIQVYSDSDFIFSFPNQDIVRAVCVFFLAHPLGLAGLPDPHETSQVRFFALDQLPPVPAFIDRMIQDALQFI